MDGPIVVGVDGSPESLAAADWAAREAGQRGLPLELLQSWPWREGHLLGGDDAVEWAKRQLAQAELDLHERHPGIEVTAVHLPEAPADALADASRRAGMLVLGSRGLSTVRGFLIGSVSQQVLGRTSCPTVLVRAGQSAAEEHQPAPDGSRTAETPFREVALGLDLRHSCEPVVRFAFETAALRSAPLRVVHAWGPMLTSEPMAFGTMAMAEQQLGQAERKALTEALLPWRGRYPEVEVVEQGVFGSAAYTLVEAASDAGLLVVGRRDRHSSIGAHIGPVTHAAVHHATCPVAVVPCR